MKTGISVTLDHKCVVWLNDKPGNKSRVINKLIIEAMRGELSDELALPWRYCPNCKTSQQTSAPSCQHPTCKSQGLGVWNE